MKVIISYLFILIIALGCSSNRIEEHPSGLDIVELHPNKLTGITKQNILHLSQVYDLRPFLFSKNIQIESGVRNQSHPVIQINTKHAENPQRLLSIFLHEQLHWWLKANKNLTLALKDVKKAYPKTRTHLHLELIACYLELRTLNYYLGEKEGRMVISQIMKKDRTYPWVYHEVLGKNLKISKIVKRYGLLPLILEPNKKPITLRGKKA
jgi:hypothetical protein